MMSRRFDELDEEAGGVESKRGFADPATLDNISLLAAVVGDGRFPIAITGFCLVLTGGFALLQTASGHLLPQDTHAIGMDATALMHVGNQRLLGFMFHDRVAYGGSLLSIGFGYMWLAGFPLKLRETWAWWALLLSGAIGFLGFLSYLGQGYLDVWHAVATAFLLPIFAAGLWRSHPDRLEFASLWRVYRPDENCVSTLGRLLLGLTAVGLMLAGLTIAIYGMTTVFIPSDLGFIGLGTSDIKRISPLLIPVISHDRAGFGVGLCSIGSFLLLVARHARLTHNLIQIVGLMGSAGFGCAIGVHFAVGYLDFLHLLPAFIGLILFIVADLLLWMGVKVRSRLDERVNDDRAG
jgi:hypothetical protein